MSRWIIGALAALACAAAQGRVTRIVIDEVQPMPAAPGVSIAYEQVAGRAFGELDPQWPGNTIIQDINLAKDSDGKVRYLASFVIVKPVDLKQSSGLMWHDVPNRGRVFGMADAERAAGMASTSSTTIRVTLACAAVQARAASAAMIQRDIRWSPQRWSAIQLSMRACSAASGTEPVASTSSLKSLRSNFGPSSRVAFARSSLIFNWPIL